VEDGAMIKGPASHRAGTANPAQPHIFGEQVIIGDNCVWGQTPAR